MTAGLQNEAPTPPTTMANVEDMVRNKVMVVKLTTGEMLIAAAYFNNERGLTLGNPYEIVIRNIELDGKWVEIPVLEKYCPYVKNRVFFFGWSNIIYAKEADNNFSNIYIEEFSRREQSDYAKLLVTCQTQLTAHQEKKTVVMFDGTMVKIEADKTFVMGNETKH